MNFSMRSIDAFKLVCISISGKTISYCLWKPKTEKHLSTKDSENLTQLQIKGPVYCTALETIQTLQVWGL